MSTNNPEVTWAAPDSGIWEHDRSHQSGVASAAVIELLPPAYADGFRHAFAELGLPISHIAIEYVNGRAYTSAFVHGAPRKPGPPPPDVVIRLASRLVPSAWRRARVAEEALQENQPMRTVARWESMRASWIDRVLGFQDVEAETLDDNDLANHVSGLAGLSSDGVRLHFELVNAAAAFGNYLVAARRWGLDAPAAMGAVMYGVPVHHEAAQRKGRLIESLGTADITDVDDIRAHSAEAAEALHDYLRFHGSWATSDDINGLTLAEQPNLLLRGLGGHEHISGTPRTLLAKLRQQVPTAERDDFDRLADEAQQAHAMLEDNSALLASWPLGLLGRSMRVAGVRLTSRGAIADPSDVWVMTTAEVAQTLRGEVLLDTDSIRQRVELARHLATVEPPDVLNGEPGPIPDPSLFPKAVGHWVAAMGAYIEAKMVAGRVVSIGSVPVSGRAVVAESVDEALRRIEPGDILVTRGTSPAMNVLIPLLAGLVTSDGGPACHAAVISREFGLSALVGMREALETIPDGATIELDPITASVRLLERADEGS